MLIFHLLSLTFAIIVIFLADKEAFAWFRGTKPTLEASRLKKLHLFMWSALLLMIGTGLTLFYPMRDYLLSNPIFYMKMGFVGILVVNGVLIGRLQHISLTKTFASLTFKEKVPLFISGAVSTFSWIAAMLLAFFLT